MLRIEELDQAVANEEGNAAASYLKKENIKCQSLLVGGASQLQHEVYDGEVIDTNLVLFAAGLSCYQLEGLEEGEGEFPKRREVGGVELGPADSQLPTASIQPERGSQ